MKRMKGVIIAGKGRVEVSDNCVLPDKINPLGALIKPMVWSPCTTDAHLCETACSSLPYMLGKATGHEMCGIVEEIGTEVKDFKVGDRVIVCSIMPQWRSLDAQTGNARIKGDNLYYGVDFADRGGSFVEHYYIRDADMNLAPIPDNVTWEQAIMVPDMMGTAFTGVGELNPAYGENIAIIGIGPVGLMAVRAAVLKGVGRIFAVGSRKRTFELASEFGATDLLDYHDEDYIDRIIDMNGGPLDGVVLCGGTPDEVNKGLKLLKRSGVLINTTVYYGVDTLPIDMALWGFGYGGKLIRTIPCGGGRVFLSRLAELISYGRVQPEKLVSHTFHGMEQIPDAMQLFLDRDRNMIKPIILND